jgi:hypothetical protein
MAETTTGGARIPGAPRRGILVRLAYWFCQRKVGRVVRPVQLAALDPPVLQGVGAMELFQERGRALPRALKTLAGLRAATLTGCPF